MEFRRSSGVLLHVSSLASRGGIGDLGPAAREFVSFLAEAQQRIWQVLPLSPTGYGHSPYSASSAFAGNPFFISLETLADWGWIARDRLTALPMPLAAADFLFVEERKLPLLLGAAGEFLDRGANEPALREQWAEFERFRREQQSWLDDYALFAALRETFRTGAWAEWPEPLRRRQPQALEEARRTHARRIAQEQALQFAFERQWRELRGFARQNGVRILGDVAIFVSMDSADVWAHPELFELDAELRPIRVAGVPPDYFSPTGQRWGNPLYRWDVFSSSRYSWWVERMRRACEFYDIVRLDHFRGFEAYWAIATEEKTAVKGEWVKGPGLALFHALEEMLGPLPLVAEDLGLITPEVDALRHALGAPGMKVMQFGFSDRGAHVHLPHRITPDTAVYTGTHDNDTTTGWWSAISKDERAAAEAYVGPVHGRPAWPLIRAASASVATLALFPAQDLLELGSEARMNTPALPSGNWRWRAPVGCWTQELAARLAAVAEVTDRDNDPLAETEESNNG
jgi:4-alpha-glucanotransferase